jgi:hypothetical protein
MIYLKYPRSYSTWVFFLCYFFVLRLYPVLIDYTNSHQQS